MSYVLDTHVLLWWFSDGSRLSDAQRRVVEGEREDEPLLVSDITLWEVATLASLGRIRLALPIREWLEKATAAPLVRLLSITPAVASEVAALPDTFHRDPADGILVATAKVHGATLLTHDRRIIDAELVPTLS